MKNAVLWDSSAILALIDRRDSNHAAAVEVARTLGTEEAPGLVTNYLACEAHALLLRKLGRLAARTWLLSDALPTVRALPKDEEHARQLLLTHEDKDWSLCDAISLAVIHRLGVRRAFSFDHHFRQFGRCEVLGLAA